MAARSRLGNAFSKNKGLLRTPSAWVFAGGAVAGRAARMLRARPEPGRRILATHHKVMTTYFSAVLRALAFKYRLKLEIGDADPTGLPDYDFYLSHNSRFDPQNLTDQRCVALVRDPRDVIVSGYFYHLWTTEAWANTRWDGNPSWTEQLNAVPKETGLMMEMRKFHNEHADILRRWGTSGKDNVLLVRYEDLMGPDKARSEGAIVQHFQLDEDMAADMHRALRLFSFENRTGRKVGNVASESHLRGGAPGGWKEHFTQAHHQFFEENLADLLALYDYK